MRELHGQRLNGGRLQQVIRQSTSIRTDLVDPLHFLVVNARMINDVIKTAILKRECVLIRFNRRLLSELVTTPTASDRDDLVLSPSTGCVCSSFDDRGPVISCAMRANDFTMDPEFVFVNVCGNQITEMLLAHLLG